MDTPKTITNRALLKKLRYRYFLKPAMLRAIVLFGTVFVLAGCGSGGDGGGGGGGADKTAPVTTITFPVGGEILSGNIGVTWNTVDDNRSVVEIALSNDSGANYTVIDPAAADDGEYTLDTTQLSQQFDPADADTFRIRITPKDIPSNTGRPVETADFTIDNKVPGITLLSPAGGAIVGGNRVNISWETHDDNPGTVRIKLSENSGSDNFSTVVVEDLPDTGSYMWDTRGFEGTTYRIQIIAIDGAGLMSQPDDTGSDIEIDNTEPSVTLVSPGAGEVISGANAVIKWDTSDENPGSVAIALSENNGDDGFPIIVETDVPDSGSYVLDTNQFNDGQTYRVQIIATDKVGNIGNPVQSNSVFAIDNTAPSIVLETPSGGELVNGSNATISWNTIDANPGSVSIYLSDNSGVDDYPVLVAENVPDIGSYSWDTTGLADGLNYRIRIVPVDRAVLPGGASESNSDFTIDNSPPIANIVFPTPVSKTSANSLTVIGTANDLSGINAVRVNGVEAVSVDQFSHWRAVVPLGVGEFTLQLETEDILGNVNSNGASSTVYNYGRNPLGSVFDGTNSRLILVESTLNSIISIDVDTGGRTLVSNNLRGTGPDFVSPVNIDLDSRNNRVLVVDQGLPGVVAVDLTSGNRTILSDNTMLSDVSFDTPTDIAIDLANNRALVADPGQTAILSVNLSSGVRTLFSAGVGSANSIAIDVNNNRLLYTNPTTLSAVCLDASFCQTVSEPFNNAIEVVSDGYTNTAYVYDSGTNELVNVQFSGGDTGGYVLGQSVVSSSTIGTGPAITNTYSISLDVPNDRAFLVDQTKSAPLTLELTSGNRQLLTAEYSWSGPGLSGETYDLEYDANREKALIVDRSPGALIGIDISNGDRHFISNGSVGAGRGFTQPISIDMDASGDFAYVADYGDVGLYSVDLDTGDRAVVVNAHLAGPVYGIVDDILVDSGKVFFTEWDQDGYFSSRELSTAGYAQLLGPYSYFSGVENGILPDTLLVYAKPYGSSSSQLISVDRTTLETTVVSDFGTGVGNGPDFTSYTSGILLDEQNSRMFVADLTSLKAVDLTNGDRSIVSGGSVGTGYNYFGLKDAVFYTNDVLFALDNNAQKVFAIDVISGDRVVISE